ncbi:MAG: hypothetical protein JHC33_06560 [Ignisphaera sp.]|nr:hypothetical protein [Ignisphaera sp.]
MDNWIISIAIALFGVIGTYAVLRYRVTAVESELKTIKIEHDKLHEREEEHHAVIHKEFVSKFDAGFKRLDTVIERIIIIEQDTKEHLNIREADERFVSHRELQLHLANIDNSMQHMSKNSDSMTRKLEELTHILSISVIKTGVKND